MVPAGGEVQSIGSGQCLTQTVCVYVIDDATFDETFTAITQGGWDFLRWNSRGDFLSADLNNPVCQVSNVLLSGNPGAEAVIASTKSFYIQPVFEQRNETITETITIAGYEVPQPDLFASLSWYQIAAVCPLWNNGICDGILNGFDMNGWAWMDSPIINLFFNAYGTTQPLPLVLPNVSGTSETNSTWAPAFFAAGWRPTDFPTLAATGTALEGWLRSEPLNVSFGSIDQMIDYDPVLNADFATSGWSMLKTHIPSTVGAWFYRVATP